MSSHSGIIFRQQSLAYDESPEFVFEFGDQDKYKLNHQLERDNHRGEPDLKTAISLRIFRQEPTEDRSV
jgi:hypothetical protein